MGEYLYKGQLVPATTLGEGEDLHVVRDPKLEFRLGRDGVRVRTQPIDLIVLHWTAGEGDATSCYNVLRRRKTAKAPKGLSVQFYSNYTGELTQYCDLDLVALHAGTVNGRSIGIEMQNKGVPPMSKKFPRGQYLTTLKGRKRSLLMFNNYQIDTLLLWLDHMCGLLKIPRKLPRVKGAVPTTTMTPAQVRAHKGVIFHYMLSGEKIDPGTQLIDILIDEGY